MLHNAIISDILTVQSISERITDTLCFFLSAKSGFTVLLRTKSPRTEMRGLLLHINVIYREQNYFLFLATTTAPAARSATPATAATPSTPVFVLGFVESPVVGAVVSAGA